MKKIQLPKKIKIIAWWLTIWAGMWTIGLVIYTFLVFRGDGMWLELAYYIIAFTSPFVLFHFIWGISVLLGKKWPFANATFTGGIVFSSIWLFLLIYFAGPLIIYGIIPIILLWIPLVSPFYLINKEREKFLRSQNEH